MFCTRLHGKSRIMSDKHIYILEAKDAEIRSFSGRSRQDAINDLQVGEELSWQLNINEGRYNICVEQASGKPEEISKYEISINGQFFNCASILTRDWRLYKSHSIGVLDLPQKGSYTLKLRPLSFVISFINIKRLRLIPIDQEPDFEVESIRVDSIPENLTAERFPLWSHHYVETNMKSPTIIVSPKSTYQRIEGIGGFFSEMGADALFSLDGPEQEKILQSLFGDEGAGFSYCGFPVGASDFAFGAYSLNDNEDDYEMSRFSLERDEDLLMPFIQRAQKVRPDLKFHSRPWGAPYWMKDTGDMTRGSLRRDSNIYKAYALYLCKFLQEYRKRGINVARLLVQNEPDEANGYPGTIWQADEYAEFVADYLVPQVRELGINSEIWAGSFHEVWKLSGHWAASFEKMRDCVDGFGFQYTLSEYVADFRMKYPDKKIMHTESACFEGNNSMQEAFGLYEDIITYFNLGADIYTYWNMILPTMRESYKGNRQNSLIKIDKSSNTVTYNPDYQIMKLFSGNIMPGSFRIEAFSFGKSVLAIKNPLGNLVLFVDNPHEKEVEANLEIENGVYNIRLPGRSLNAVKINYRGARCKELPARSSRLS